MSRQQSEREMLRGRMTPTTLLAECQDCKWFIETGRYDADRMAARRHAERHNHRVRVETSKSFVYDGRKS